MGRAIDQGMLINFREKNVKKWGREISVPPFFIFFFFPPPHPPPPVLPKNDDGI